MSSNPRPHDTGYLEYGGYGTERALSVADNRAELVIAAPRDRDAEIFVQGYTAKVGYTGTGLVEFMRTDGVVIWCDAPPAQDTWGRITLPGEHGLPSGAAGEGLSIAITADELSACEMNVLYRYL